MRIRSVLTHSAQAILEGALIATMVVALIAGTAFAARGGGGGHTKPGGGATGGSGTISLVTPPVVDKNGNGTPNRGDSVTFDVSTAATSEPFVNLQCFQNGVRVLNGSAGYFAWAMNAPYYDFTLNSGMWSGGAADCTAYLQESTTRGWTKLASTSFHVEG